MKKKRGLDLTQWICYERLTWQPRRFYEYQNHNIYPIYHICLINGPGRDLPLGLVVYNKTAANDFTAICLVRHQLGS